MDTNLPKVSILITTFKRPQLLGNCLKSIRSQVYSNYEIIIIDDNPLGISESVAKEHENIFNIGNRYRYLKNPINLGYQHSLNRGLDEAKGKYIAILDDDDVWIAEEKLKLQVDFLDNNPDHVLVGTGVIQVDSSGNEVRRKLPPEKDLELRGMMLEENNFAHSSVMYSREAALKVGGYVIKKWNYYSEDEILWIKLGTVGKVANLSIYGIKYLSQNRGTLYNFKYAFIPSLRQLIIIKRYRKEYQKPLRASIIKILISLRCLMAIISDFPPFKNIKNIIKTTFPGGWRKILKLRKSMYNGFFSIIRKSSI